MRYIGQAEQMNYDKEGSEAYEDDILRACHLFGYEDAYVTYKSTVNFDDVTETTLISDEDWSALMQSELVAGRPMVFCAYDYSYASNSYFGHAFDVDGDNATDGTFHINWGWSGTGNGYFALNAFSYQGTNYHIGQLVVMGIEPPADAATIKVFPETVNVEASPGKPATATFTIKGRLLNGDITMTLNDPAGVFSLDANSVSVAESQDGKNITVTYVPQALGSNTATVTLSSPEAADKTVTINGTAVMEKHDPVMLPVDSNYISLTSYRADWTDETPAANVESYTLEVSSKPDVKLVAEADFSTLPSGGNVGSQASQYLPEGWTLAGSTLYLDGGCITPTSGEKITTCPYDFTAYDQLTVVITAKSYSTYSPADVTVSTSKGSQKVAFSSNYEEYVVVLDCSDTESIQFLSGYYPMIQNIKIYAGNLTAQSGQRVEDEGDTSYRLITGITDKFYMVTGLTEAGTFFYKVKAQFADGSDSAWSNPQVVTLFDNGSTLPTHELGDVNHDGDVNISDAITLINYLLNDSGDICTTCANVNGDDEVNITDAIDLINMLLNNV